MVREIYQAKRQVRDLQVQLHGASRAGNHLAIRGLLQQINAIRRRILNTYGIILE